MSRGKYEKWLTPEGLAKVSAWALAGLTDEDIAHNMGVSRKTLHVWREKFDALDETLRRDKAAADAIVENALYKSATGFAYDEVTRERALVTDEKTGKQVWDLVETKRVTRHVPPHSTSIIFWLKNRRPDLYRDLQNHEGNIKLEISMDGEIEAFAQ